MYVDLSLVATIIGGVCVIKLARILVNHALKREIPCQPFSRLRVAVLTMAIISMVIVALGA